MPSPDREDGIRSFHTLPPLRRGETAGSGDRLREEDPLHRASRTMGARSVPRTPPRTVLEHLARRFSSVGEMEWAGRMERGRVTWDDGTRVDRETAYAPGRRLIYLREVPGEPEPEQPVRILYIDDEIVVVDKPAGIPVTPSGGYVRRSLLAQVRSILSNPELTPAHRIDRDTSGLVLFVQRAEDRSTFQGLFARRAVHKVYEAICRGESEPPAFTTVRSRIERTDDRFRWRSVPDPVGPSRSDVYLVGADAAAGAASWPARGTVGRAGGRADAQSQFTPGSRPEPTRWRFRIVPESGRPHQVRLHLDQLGFPLVGDPLYPQRRQVPVTEGPLRLLAAELRFRDPRTRVWRFFRTEQSLTDLATAPEA